MRTFARAQRRASLADRAKRGYGRSARADPAVRALLRAPPTAQRECANCEEEKQVQRAAASPAGARADASTTVAAGTASGGAPLPAAARHHFEPRFGRDFGDVRVHTGPQAAASARELNAHAYTFGQDVVFGDRQYDPGSAAGQRLLAHELAHVVQQTDGDRAAVRRQPAPPALPKGGTQSLHEGAVEEYRKAHGLPPRGINPISGEQVGPTDQEIRFGGLLEAWLTEKSGAIAAPEQAPKLVGAGTQDVRTGCKTETGNDEEWYHSCRRHREFAANIYPRAVENIRSVASPYSEAIAKLYASVLPAVKLLAGATPKQGDFPLSTIGGFPGPLTFGATTHTFPDFTLLLDQKHDNVTAAQRDLSSGGISIRINEMSDDMLLQNFPVIESAMVHEALHAFSKVVEDKNLAGIARGVAGLPARAPVDLNLDRSGYGALKGELEAAVTPFVRQIQQLPSFGGKYPLSVQFDAEWTARSMMGEAISRVEEAIYQKQRAGQGFTSGDLGSMPPFYTFAGYWYPQPTVETELVDFLKGNLDEIDKRVRPTIIEIGARYLSLRPRVQREASAPGPAATDVSASVAAGTASGGAPLPAEARRHFEPRFGRDFGDVRVHTGPQAAASARELNAHAYTFGQDVVFGAGQYDPDGAAGRRLLAHELAHVVQQGEAPSPARLVRRESVMPVCEAPDPPLPEGTTVTYPMESCSKERCEGKEGAIDADLDRALGYTARAISALEGKVSGGTERLLDWYFNDHGAATVGKVRELFTHIEKALQDTLAEKRYVCSAREAPIAKTGGADKWCVDTQVPICLFAPYFGKSARGRATTLIHEAGHRIGLSSAGDVPDIYSWEWSFLELSAAQAIRTTDSYAHFAAALSQGAPTTIIPLLGGQGGLTSTGSGFLKFRGGAEFQHPSLRGINPTAGITMGVFDSSFVASAFVGARFGDARAEGKWSVYLDVTGGLSFIGRGEKATLSPEAEARIGVRIGSIDVGLTGGVIRDRSRDEGASTVYTGGLAVSWIPDFYTK